MRLDLYIAKLYPDLSRSQAKRLIESGHVRLKGTVCLKAHQDVAAGNVVEIDIPPLSKPIARPENIQIEVLYEDKDLIVINKPAGMVVHPGAGQEGGTLVNALLHHCKDLSGIGGSLRPGIVHRLDKGTSGVMVVAKNDLSHLNLSSQFKSRTVEKKYYALVYGFLPRESGIISVPIGRHVTDRKKMSAKTKKGRASETHYKVIRRFGKELTLVDVRLATGRTHQIRVHFAHIGHPLVGDELYGGKAIKRLQNKELINIIKLFSRPVLHSYKLVFSHPRDGRRMEFSVDLPTDLKGPLKLIHGLS